jgi:hypothetical protein
VLLSAICKGLYYYYKLFVMFCVCFFMLVWFFILTCAPLDCRFFHAVGLVILLIGLCV